MLRPLLIVSTLTLLLASSGATYAQNCGWGYPLYGYGYGYGGYNLYGGEHIPYFALYPPVYYSYPVPRTYGYSPFAYPPGVMTPEIEISENTGAKVMVNPYVPRQRAEETAPERTTSLPLRIRNPYFEGNPADSQPQLAGDLPPHTGR